MTLFAYLDEFGHIGPYVGREDPRYKESPVFGLAGFVLPAEAVRGIGIWFFQRKCELLAFEIERSGEHPALWEKKGSGVYTVTNVTRYPELRKFTNRLFNKIERLGGFVSYVGVRKTAAPGAHNPNRLYAQMFRDIASSEPTWEARERIKTEMFAIAWLTDVKAALKKQLKALTGERIAALEALGETKAKGSEAASASGRDVAETTETRERPSGRESKKAHEPKSIEQELTL